MPEGAIYVGRPTRWGNPWRVGFVNRWIENGVSREGTALTVADAVALYRADLLAQLTRGACDLTPLRGHDLACWCPLDQPCHADVLLELANR